MRNVTAAAFMLLLIATTGRKVVISLGGHDCAECAINLPKAVANSCDGLNSDQKSKLGSLLAKQIRGQRMTSEESEVLQVLGSTYLSIVTFDRPVGKEMLTTIYVQPACRLNEAVLRQAFAAAKRPVKEIR